jgi:hypothetical protein
MRTLSKDDDDKKETKKNASENPVFPHSPRSLPLYNLYKIQSFGIKRLSSKGVTIFITTKKVEI